MLREMCVRHPRLWWKHRNLDVLELEQLRTLWLQWKTGVPLSLYCDNSWGLSVFFAKRMRKTDTSSISNYKEANLPSQCEKVERMHLISRLRNCHTPEPTNLFLQEEYRGGRAQWRIWTDAILTRSPTNAAPKVLRMSVIEEVSMVM